MLVCMYYASLKCSTTDVFWTSKGRQRLIQTPSPMHDKCSLGFQVMNTKKSLQKLNKTYNTCTVVATLDIYPFVSYDHIYMINICIIVKNPGIYLGPGI